jgi:hypothetical protein
MNHIPRCSYQSNCKHASVDVTEALWRGIRECACAAAGTHSSHEGRAILGKDVTDVVPAVIVTHQRMATF